MWYRGSNPCLPAICNWSPIVASVRDGLRGLQPVAEKTELLATCLSISVFGGTLGAIDDEDIDLLLSRFEPQAKLFP